MLSALGAGETQAFTTFGIVSITGPVVGVIVGGSVTTALGGYSAPKTMYVALGLACFCLLCAAPIPFINDFWLFTVLLWLLLFSGGFILPPMTGIMLATIDARLKTTANSLANLIYNLGGYLPGPFIYGAVYEWAIDSCTEVGTPEQRAELCKKH